MSNGFDSTASRRAFLKFVAASPLFAAMPTLGLQGAEEFIITDPSQAINVFEFEAASRKALPPAHWGYITTGVDDDATLKANREGFAHYQLRTRRLIDTSKIDMSVELFGTTWETPIALAPCGTVHHPEGAVALARAAKTQKTLQILSSGQETKHTVEAVIKARGGPVWYQLYASQDWNETMQTVTRIEKAGCPVLVWTVDNLPGRNLETLQHLRRLDTRECSSCHSTPPRVGPGRAARNILTWDHLKKLKDSTKMRVVVKGIENPEDAELCVSSGADGLVVSNHGGRAAESGRATIDSLPEVLQVVRNRIPVLVDGGFRRGTDIFKALALGAKTVCIGRPYIWGLSAFGTPGAEAVLAILRREFNLVMAQCGKHSLAEIDPASIIKVR